MTEAAMSRSAVEETLRWRAGDDALDIGLTRGLTRGGDGPVALLPPAVSSISTRAEMAPLAERRARPLSPYTTPSSGFTRGGRTRRPP